MRSIRRDRGAAAVELGILLPLLLLIVLGIIDFGRMLNAQVTLTQAAREGSRLAALGNADADVTTRTQDAATSLESVGVSITACPDGSGSGSDARVTATYTFEFVTPVGDIGAMFGGGGYGDPITLSAEGVMPCEG
jgi:Flp pilus assembly protein TadG